MFRKLLFMTVALLGMAVLSSNAFASESINMFNLESMSEVSSYDGTYYGTLTRVYMNGEKTTGQSVTAYVEDNGDGTINLSLGSFQVGSMPGSIAVQADNITVNSDGSFNVPTADNAVILKILGITSKFDASIVGQLNGNSLTFTVNTINAKYLGVSFEAIVTFEGSK